VVASYLVDQLVTRRARRAERLERESA
jgi:hypothetical protein